MKVNKLPLLIVFLISNVIFAQSNYKFGVEAGPIYKSYRGTDIFENTTNKLGYLLGFSVEYKFNDKYSIKSGFRYEKNRIDYDSDYTTYWIRTDDYGQEYLGQDKYIINTTNSYTFLTLPIVLKYKITTTNPFYINGGIFVSKMSRSIKYNVEVENRNTSYPYYYNPKQNYTLENQIGNQDYGFIVGFGKTFSFSKNELSIELIDNIGVYNLLDEENLNGENTKLRSNTINLLLNFTLN